MSDPNDTSYELITAYVDGELSDDERARVEALLEQSEEHRLLHQDLQSLQGRFSDLPSERAPEKLVGNIMDAIADLQIDGLDADSSEQPVEPAIVKLPTAKQPETGQPGREATSTNWVGGMIRLAIAASLLIVAWTVYRTFVPGTTTQDLVITPEVAPNGEQVVDVDPGNGVNDRGANDPDRVGPETVVENRQEDLLDTQFVFQDVACDLLLIFAYEVEPRLLENDTFQNTLKMHDIELGETITPDAEARQSILQSAAFGVAEAPGGRQRQGAVQFSIVVADIDKLFLISESLNAVDGVKSMQVDLSVKANDIHMMRNLDRSRRLNSTANVMGERAYFVSLGGELEGMLMGPAGATMMKLDGLGGLAQAGAQGLGQQRMMPVAFILRAATE